MLEIDKWKKYSKEGLHVTIIGFIIFLIGIVLYSITETHIVWIGEIPLSLTSRPYDTIGGFMMYFGLVGIVGGLISKIYYENKFKKFLRGD